MSDDQTLRTYGEKLADYTALGFSETERAALEDFLARLPTGAHVLDLGCGPGLHAAEMMRHGVTVSALDATPQFVAAAREAGVDAHLGTFDDLTEAAAYDGLWASFSLLHAPRADFPRHLDAIRRALKPGGLLFLGLKLGEGEHRDSLGRFYSYFTEEELRRHLDQTAFRDIRATRGEGVGLAGSLDPFILITTRKG